MRNFIILSRCGKEKKGKVMSDWERHLERQDRNLKSYGWISWIVVMFVLLAVIALGIIDMVPEPETAAEIDNGFGETYGEGALTFTNTADSDAITFTADANYGITINANASGIEL